MLSNYFYGEAKKYFDKVSDLLGDRKEEVLAAVSEADEDERACLQFCYGTLPLSDIGEYDVTVIRGFVRHALFVREKMEWCRKLPEEIFVHYVLYPRINSEKLVDCRKMFYDLLCDRVEGMNELEAVLETNYWCAEHATYKVSDGRTLSALAVYTSGDGRCGEESTFAVTVFRSLGIAARQVYVPRWAHCDDNHAWVEVFVDGKWQFLGACEPEELLNRGWFTGASSRALLVHTRNFSDYTDPQCPVKERAIGQEGALYYLNDTATYARTVMLSVNVKDANGNPADGVLVAVEILNESEYFPAAVFETGEDGRIEVELGIGDVHIHVSRNGAFAECVCSSDCKVVVLTLPLENGPNLEYDWVDYNLTAPSDYPVHNLKPTPEQNERNQQRRETAQRLREDWVKGFFDEERALKHPEALEYLTLAGGNFEEIVKFLEGEANPYRLKLLKELKPKDFKDAQASVLEEHLNMALLHRGTAEEELFVPYVLCPRICYENMSAYRSYLWGYFDADTRMQFEKQPESIWNYIEEHITRRPDKMYNTLQSAPEGCLRAGCATEISRRILFVAICRTLGIPARLNPVDMEAQYHNGQEFVTVSAKSEGKAKPSSSLVLTCESETELTYHKNWTLAILDEETGSYRSLDYDGFAFEDGSLALELVPGNYRLITSSRMPNGNQLVSATAFAMAEGQTRSLAVRLRQGRVEDMISAFEIPDFVLTSKTGGQIPASSLVTEQPAVIAFLEAGKEPTEHVLNELMEQKDKWLGRQKQIYLVVDQEKALAQATIARALSTFPEVNVLYDSFTSNTDTLARKLYLEPGIFPLLVLLKPDMTAAYGCAGYNVGSVELIGKILKVEEK